MVELNSRIGASTPVLPPRPPTEEVAPPRPLEGFRQVWTGGYAPGLTPARIASMLEQADQGQPSELLQCLQETEDRDLHIVGVLGTRKRAVTQLPWEVEPADDSRRARKIADWTRTMLRRVDDLEGGLVGLMDGVYKGFAVRELDWAIEGGEVALRRLQYRPAWWFRPDDADPEQLRLLSARDPLYGVPLVPGRFATHLPQAKTGVPVQAGLGRAILWWYLFKNLAMKDWVTFVELFGAPLRIGRAPVSARPADVTKLEMALRKLGVDAYAVIPQDMGIEFIDAKKAGGSGGSGGAEAFEKMFSVVNAEISKVVLGQTLTTEQGATGAKALGEVHNQVRLDLQRSDAHQLARTVNRDIVRPAVTWQWGADAPMPRYCIEAEPPGDEKLEEETRLARAKVFDMARSLGVAVPVAQVREELDIREPMAGEEVLPPAAGQRAPAPAPASSRLVRGSVRFAASADGELSDQLVAVADHFLSSGGLAAWGELVATLRRELARAQSPEELADLYLQIIAELRLEGVAQSLADATLTAELVGRAQVQAGDQPIPDVPLVPPAEAIAYWTGRGVVSADEFYRLADQHRTRAFSAAGFGALTALQETKDLLGEILQQGGTFADFEDAMDGVFSRAGMEPKSPWRLRTIYHNAVGTSYSVGRWVEQQQPGRLARRPYLRYHDAGDFPRVRPTHHAMAGRVWPASHPIWQVWYPLNGHLCRCYVTAHSLEEVIAAGWVIEGELPIVTEGPQAGEPLLPDAGWRSNPAIAPADYDWSKFDPAWRAALRARPAA